MLINISKYIGLVFEDRGRGPNGYDCWGLLSLIYKEEFGVNLPSYLDNYKDTKDSDSIGTLMRQERDNWKAIKTPWEILGDVVGFYRHWSNVTL